MSSARRPFSAMVSRLGGGARAFLVASSLCVLGARGEEPTRQQIEWIHSPTAVFTRGECWVFDHVTEWIPVGGGHFGNACWGVDGCRLFVLVDGELREFVGHCSGSFVGYQPAWDILTLLDFTEV